MPCDGEFDATLTGDRQPAVDLGVNPNINEKGSVGGLDLNNRLEVLERRIADVSNDLDVFKAFVLENFESFNNNFE